MNRILFHLMAGLMLAGGTAFGATLYVSPDGSGVDGLSWETSFRVIGKAIESATAGDDIWVASGVYEEGIVLIPGISLYGGFSGSESPEEFSKRDWRKNGTILNGKRLGLSRGRGVQAADNTRVDGLRVYEFSGGVECKSATMTLANCHIAGNVRAEGAGVQCADGNMTILGCVFEQNMGLDGVGAWFFRSYGRITNSFFTAHWTGAPRSSGGGYGTIYILGQGSKLFIEHCTLASNEAVWDFPGLVSDQHGLYEVRNSIVMGRNGSALVNSTVSYSNIEGVTGEGVINEAPQDLFVNPFGHRDFRLKAGSPAIDSATSSILSVDLDGNPRPVDVPGVPNNPTAYDMGCYEYQLPVGDLNGDGKVDAKDLLIFQGQWMRED